MDKIIAGKAVLSVALCLLAMVCLRVSDSPRKFDWSAPWLVALFLSLRIAIFVGCFVILKFEAQSDVLEYFRLARLVADGNIPGATDLVPMHYGPLFLYVIAFVIRLWDDPKAIIVFMVICEFFSFVLWLWLSNKLVDKTTKIRAAILYACCPLSIFAGVISGNNDLLAGLFLTVGIVLAVANRPAWSGALLGLSVVASKALTIMSGIPLFFASNRKMTWLLGAVLPVVMTYGLWMLLSVDVIAGFRFHAAHYSSGNLPFALGLMGLDSTAAAVRSAINLVGAALVLAVAGLPFLQRRQISNLDAIILIAAANILYLLVGAKSFPHYVTIVLFPITLALAMGKDRTRIFLLYVAYNISASLESSLWFRWFRNGSPAEVNGMLPDNVVQYMAFATTEVVLLVSYALMAWGFVRLYLVRGSTRAMPL